MLRSQRTSPFAGTLTLNQGARIARAGNVGGGAGSGVGGAALAAGTLGAADGGDGGNGNPPGGGGGGGVVVVVSDVAQPAGLTLSTVGGSGFQNGSPGFTDWLH